jgi:DNA-binding NtrC family response regulator
MPVIMMSGHATIDTAVVATRIGALNFLEKPIAMQKLLKAVQAGLARGQEVARAPVMTQRPAALPPVEEAAPPTFGAPAMPQPAAHGIAVARGSGEGHMFSLSFDLPLREARDAFERMYFEHHLGREGGSMTRVAEKTGLERTHLYRKLKQLGVEPGKLAKKNQQA